MSWLFFWRKKRSNGQSRVATRTTNDNKPRRTFALASLFRRNNVKGFKIYKQEELTPDIDPYAQVDNGNKVINLPAGANFVDAGNPSQYMHNKPPPVKPRKKRTVFTSFAQSFSRFRSIRPAQTAPRTGQVQDRIRRLQNGNTMNNRTKNKDPLRFNTGGGHENQGQFSSPQPREQIRKNYSGVPLPKQPHWQIQKNARPQQPSRFQEAETNRTNYSGVPMPKKPSWQVKKEKTTQPSWPPTNQQQFSSSVSEKQSRYEQQHGNQGLPTIFKNDPYSKSRPLNGTNQSASQSRGFERSTDATFQNKPAGTNFGSKHSGFSSTDTTVSTPVIRPTYERNKRVEEIEPHARPSWQNSQPSWSKPNSPPPVQPRTPTWQTEKEQSRTPPQQKWKRKTDVSQQSTRRKTDNTFTPNYNKPAQTFAKPPIPPKPIVKKVPARKVRSPGGIVLQNREQNLRESIKGLRNLAGFWDQVGENNRKKQEANPFSSHFNGKREVATGNILGSKSDERARKAQEWTNKEIERVVQVIKDYGQYDAASKTTMITFGELFLIYEKISDTLVFMLLKARKRNRITFDGGEMLLQGRDDHVKIYVRH